MPQDQYYYFSLTLCLTYATGAAEETRKLLEPNQKVTKRMRLSKADKARVDSGVTTRERIVFDKELANAGVMGPRQWSQCLMASGCTHNEYVCERLFEMVRTHNRP